MKAAILISGYSKEDLTFEAAEELKSGKEIILHTAKSELADWLISNSISFTALDHLYDNSFDFSEHIKRALAYLHDLDSFIFCVMDTSDEVAKAFIEQYPDTHVIGGGSNAALELRSCNGLLIYSAYEVLSAELSPLHSILIKEIDDRLLAGEIKLKLQYAFSDDVDLFFRLPNGKIISLKLRDLDRLKSYDHRCACLLTPEKEPKVCDFESLKLISSANGVNDADLNDETIAKSLADVVKYIRLNEKDAFFTQEELFERAADIIKKESNYHE